MAIHKLILIALLTLLAMLSVSCRGEAQAEPSKIQIVAIEKSEAENCKEFLEGVWMETEYETYIEGTQDVKVKWYNIVDDTMSYGQFFVLEKKIDDQWMRITKESAIEYGFSAEAMNLQYNTSRWHTYNLIAYTDGLTQGNYRINTVFSRDTLKGLDYGSGNYPDYQVFGYFVVGKRSIERSMTSLMPSSFEYKNEQFGIAMTLTDDWEGFLILEEENDRIIRSDEIYQSLDENYSILRIRHPKWTDDKEYQDIVILIFNKGQWNGNAMVVTNGNLDLLPDNIMSNHKYVFAIVPQDYSGKRIGNEGVLKILEDSVQGY